MEDKYKTVTRNLEEILVEDELKHLLRTNPHPRVYCGYEVSGPVHLGHLANIRKLIDFQKVGMKVIVLLADYHTMLNLKGNLDWIEKMANYYKKTFLAVGLHHKKTTFVLGSKFEKKGEYFSDLLKLSLSTTIIRGVRSMQGVARDIENAHISQMIYPLMQILDMKYLKVDAALGGMEQRKIHVLAREIIDTVGWKKPVCLHNELLVSLQGPQSKMSSSLPHTVIQLHESPKEIRNKINNAYCPAKQIQGNPILQIVKMLVFPRFGEFEIKRKPKFGGDIKFDSYEGLEFTYKDGFLHPADLKNAVSEYLIEMLRPVREYFKDNNEFLRPLYSK
jgi:tyrosyl-tRNA synthetase